MAKNHLPFLLITLAFGLATCRGCRETGPSAILDLPAGDALAAVIVPDLGALARGADEFAERATRRAGGQVLAKMRKSLVTQIGFDAFDPEGYEALGLQPDGGCLVFTEGEHPEPLLAFTVSDRDRFDIMIKALIKRTDGAGTPTTSEAHGWTVMTANRPFGDELVPAYHWVHAGRFALTARQEGKAALDAALARLAASKAGDARASLRADPTYRQLARKVEAGALTVFARGRAAAGLVSSPKTDAGGMITSVTLDSHGLATDTFLELDVPGLDAALASSPVLSLAGRVADDAAALVLTRVARPASVRALRAHPATAGLVDRVLEPLRAATGIEAENEVLPLLAGPLTVSVHLQDLRQLLPRMRQSRSLGTALQFVHIAVTAEVADPTAFKALLERSRTRLAERGVELRTRQKTSGALKATVYEPDRPQPRFGWAIAGTTYVYGAGAGRLDVTLETLGKGDSGLATRLATTVAGELGKVPNKSIVVLRASQIADAATTITLAQGKAVGLAALFGAALELLRSVDDVAMAVSGEPGGLRLQVRERLR